MIVILTDGNGNSKNIATEIQLPCNNIRVRLYLILHVSYNHKQYTIQHFVTVIFVFNMLCIEKRATKIVFLLKNLS